MATGSPDYWPSKYELYKLADTLDALDGIIDGQLTLDQLNLSDVKTNLDDMITNLMTASEGFLADIETDLVAVVQNLDGTIGTLKSSIDELVGVHTDTTLMVAYGEEDTDGGFSDDAWYLVASINVRRNMLKVDITVRDAYYSRSGVGDPAGSISAGSSATFYDSPGVWLKAVGLDGLYAAHEEWAT